MLVRLFLLFTIIPVIELYVLIRIGKAIGALPTVGILVATAFAGAWLAKRQGFIVLRQIQEELARGRMPASQLLDGALILAGGILLLTPGFFTDFLGLFFLVPFTRSALKMWIGRALRRKIEKGTIIFRRF